MVPERPARRSTPPDQFVPIRGPDDTRGQGQSDLWANHCEVCGVLSRSRWGQEVCTSRPSVRLYRRNILVLRGQADRFGRPIRPRHRDPALGLLVVAGRLLPAEQPGARGATVPRRRLSPPDRHPVCRFPFRLTLTTGPIWRSATQQSPVQLARPTVCQSKFTFTPRW